MAAVDAVAAAVVVAVWDCVASVVVVDGNGGAGVFGNAGAPAVGYAVSVCGRGGGGYEYPG